MEAGLTGGWTAFPGAEDGDWSARNIRDSVWPAQCNWYCTLESRSKKIKLSGNGSMCAGFRQFLPVRLYKNWFQEVVSKTGHSDAGLMSSIQYSCPNKVLETGLLKKRKEISILNTSVLVPAGSVPS
jgi:hypothetical protein